MQTPRKNSTSALNASTSPVVLSSSESFMSSSTTVSSTRTTDILTTMWQRDGPTNSSSRDTPSRSRSPEPSFASSDVSIVPMAMSTSKAVLSTFDAGETLPSTVYSTSLLSEEMTTVMPTSVPEDENDMCFPMRETTYPRDCAEIQTSCTERLLVNGEYVIQPEGYPYASFPVYCDFQTDDGNWTVIQRRIDGSINFERNWQDYKSGFGFLNTEFWLGNEKLHYLTSQTTYEILIELKNVHNDLFIAKYSKFRVGDEGVHYRLILGPYNGNAGNQLSKHANAHFSTPDADHDSSPNSNCADIHGGGWWFVQCDWCNLNGVYGLNENAGGIEWEGLPGGSYGLRATEMKIRPLH
ncbi:Fibrinogen-like protein A [Holothuria leucospilota]|uniref:Fibrinogen-like protein A n=1 Tax=Holothuria leucospilota TaxID=206669 RepID=A0A9Q1HI70_HOLLE|nr:Fibrinogen-like protein A [Holothuria leucospilota]